MSGATRSMNAFRSIVRALYKNSKAIERDSGLTLAQFLVLEELAMGLPLTTSQLAMRVGTHVSSVSVVLNRLVQRRLVVRTVSEQDRRCSYHVLSPEGRTLLAIAPATVPHQLLNGLAALPTAAKIELADLLERWLQLAGVEHPP